jgi:hypothetical protein
MSSLRNEEPNSHRSLGANGRRVRPLQVPTRFIATLSRSAHSRIGCYLRKRGPVLQRARPPRVLLAMVKLLPETGAGFGGTGKGIRGKGQVRFDEYGSEQDYCVKGGHNGRSGPLFLQKRHPLQSFYGLSGAARNRQASQQSSFLVCDTAA